MPFSYYYDAITDYFDYHYRLRLLISSLLIIFTFTYLLFIIIIFHIISLWYAIIITLPLLRVRKAIILFSLRKMLLLQKILFILFSAICHANQRFRFRFAPLAYFHYSYFDYHFSSYWLFSFIYIYYAIFGLSHFAIRLFAYAFLHYFLLSLILFRYYYFDIIDFHFFDIISFSISFDYWCFHFFLFSISFIDYHFLFSLSLIFIIISLIICLRYFISIAAIGRYAFDYWLIITFSSIICHYILLLLFHSFHYIICYFIIFHYLSLPLLSFSTLPLLLYAINTCGDAKYYAICLRHIHAIIIALSFHYHFRALLALRYIHSISSQYHHHHRHHCFIILHHFLNITTINMSSSQ